LAETFDAARVSRRERIDYGCATRRQPIERLPATGGLLVRFRANVYADLAPMSSFA